MRSTPSGGSARPSPPPRDRSVSTRDSFLDLVADGLATSFRRRARARARGWLPLIVRPSRGRRRTAATSAPPRRGIFRDSNARRSNLDWGVVTSASWSMNTACDWCCVSRSMWYACTSGLTPALISPRQLATKPSGSSGRWSVRSVSISCEKSPIEKTSMYSAGLSSSDAVRLRFMLSPSILLLSRTRRACAAAATADALRASAGLCTERAVYCTGPAAFRNDNDGDTAKNLSPPSDVVVVIFASSSLRFRQLREPSRKR